MMPQAFDFHVVNDATGAGKFPKTGGGYPPKHDPGWGGAPPGSTIEQGVFAIRSPDRPNPVSICLVDLLGIEDGILQVRGLDAFDGTPVIDIKPYFSDIDSPSKKLMISIS